MDSTTVYAKLEEQCPTGYKINEIIRFSYPYRRLKIKATVNKSPDQSIQQIYAVLLRAILAGFNKEKSIVEFLGLHADDFILRELYFLRERGYLDFISGSWIVSKQGVDFINDHSILKVLEEEEFEFFLDCFTDEILPKNFNSFSDKNTEKRIHPVVNFEHKSFNLLKNKSEQLGSVYKNSNEGKAFLVDYNPNEILFDKVENNDYFLVEYIPQTGNEDILEPYIEIRNPNQEVSKESRLTSILSLHYPSIIYDFSDSERVEFVDFSKNVDDISSLYYDEEFNEKLSSKVLSVWETQSQFEEVLKTVKTKLLIESPWIKRATLQYIPLMQEALKRGVKILIIYGIEYNDDHFEPAIQKLRALGNNYPKQLKLIHLPSYLHVNSNAYLSGTHRKLVIKDEDYYLLGSFNFLSFNKKEGQKVANEESMLITEKVKEKWLQVYDDYQI